MRNSSNQRLALVTLLCAFDQNPTKLDLQLLSVHRVIRATVPELAIHRQCMTYHRCNHKDMAGKFNEWCQDHTSSSPGCRSSSLKSTERISTRAGVPVLRRSVSNPKPWRFSVRPTDADSPALPAAMEALPTQIFPFMNVPVVTTTEGAKKSTPKNVRTPITLSLLPINTSVTIASRICRFSVLLQKPHNNKKVDLCCIDKSKKYCQELHCLFCHQTFSKIEHYRWWFLRNDAPLYYLLHLCCILPLVCLSPQCPYRRALWPIQNPLLQVTSVERAHTWWKPCVKKKKNLREMDVWQNSINVYAVVQPT